MGSYKNALYIFRSHGSMINLGDKFLPPRNIKINVLCLEILEALIYV